ncbi:hypothetical protein DUI87_07511 [Hirundo rustica rustica]|uniref:Uncharacterized protein n=1 Tax=Hirundo rustica rustica TaxID=333673 RepID=A0A3M0KRN7_HIRRU|nr:hypothetical protein DUI87_07511 [Hirundo rustica rustica]
MVGLDMSFLEITFFPVLSGDSAVNVVLLMPPPVDPDAEAKPSHTSGQEQGSIPERRDGGSGRNGKLGLDKESTRERVLEDLLTSGYAESPA